LFVQGIFAESGFDEFGVLWARMAGDPREARARTAAIDAVVRRVWDSREDGINAPLNP
jgi:hypothetical protein